MNKILEALYSRVGEQGILIPQGFEKDLKKILHSALTEQIKQLQDDLDSIEFNPWEKIKGDILISDNETRNVLKALLDKKLE